MDAFFHNQFDLMPFREKSPVLGIGFIQIYNLVADPDRIPHDRPDVHGDLDTAIESVFTIHGFLIDLQGSDMLDLWCAQW